MSILNYACRKKLTSEEAAACAGVREKPYYAPLDDLVREIRRLSQRHATGGVR